ncbi:MAG: hypothetical protein Q8R92_03100 [Deltaproteobacteria bacterium]|nr:hypothetical protein [Deltaproteobacteria bacterium]
MSLYRRPHPIALIALFALLILAAAPAARAQDTVPAGEPRGPGESWIDPPATEEPPAAPDTGTAGIDARLQARADALYGFLQGKRVNLYALYTNESFRDFFTTEEALENYVAFLTNTLARRRFKKYRIERTEFVVITPEGADAARAQVRLVGRHVHVVFFWDVTETIENSWKRIDGEWFVFPPPF